MLGLGVLGVVVGADVQRGTDRFVAPLREKDPTGLTGLLPSSGFRYYSVVGHVPVRTSADYELTINGLVDRPLRLTLDDLSRMPQTELVRDFQCVTGWRVPKVRWTGVPLASLLDAAGPRPGAGALTFRSFDGAYDESLTLEQARHPEVLVALTMLDGPITHDHGGPVRLYVAPMYGYKSIKWL
ncbi:molybdopterin-dependent oxidoreductase, partial [Frankia sp. EI5c]|uniref:molybdopterin-dependent oxidoreductase n=1 Tax=Frankia sp. EI5c TaxID=683316 RepID=UPI001F5BE54B